MHITIAICSAVLVILTVSLALRVSLLRKKTGIITGSDDPSKPLAKAIRAHGNTAEYSGLIIALFAVTSISHQGRDLGLTVSSMVILLTFARIIHAFGFLISESLENIHVLKALGALLTYVFCTLLSLMVIVRAF